MLDIYRAVAVEGPALSVLSRDASDKLSAEAIKNFRSAVAIS